MEFKVNSEIFGMAHPFEPVFFSVFLKRCSPLPTKKKLTIYTYYCCINQLQFLIAKDP